MSAIETWLQSQNLGQYKQSFIENGVDLRSLPELTDEDLKEIGVALGHRRLIQRLMREQPKPEDESASATITGTTETTPVTAKAEHRQITVMFCDLVGSVALGERMDLDDYRDLLAHVRNATVQSVESHNGFVARHQGDGLLAYFGYPQAREDDAERALLAAFAARDAMEALAETSSLIQVRTGIATGPAIVGDVLATGASSQSEFAALGTTPNLAARLQSCAEPGQVLVSDVTYAMTERTFEFEAVEVAPKGIGSNVVAYRVVGRREAGNRLDITSGQRLTPLVGREEELALLTKRWKQAQDGSGQIVLISAEPGVGKTRMMMEAYHRFGDADCATLVWFCSPNHTDSALHPISDYIARTLSERDENSSDDRIANLERWFNSLSLDPDRLVPLLAPLASLDVPERYQRRVPDGAEHRRRTLAALVDIVLAHAARGPVLLAVEDLHWMDPSTSELLSLLIEAIRDQPVLGLFTFRPEFVSPWSMQAHSTTLSLNHLTGSECRAFVQGIDAGAELPADIVEQLIERTDGVPLFLEELSKTVLESQEVGATKIPATLLDALTARLDRLGEAKELAQVASIVGRVFPLWLLRAAAPHRAGNITADIEHLANAGLVYRHTLTGTEHYAFKHALVRDCAYQSLIRDERERLHTQVANALSTAHDAAAAPAELIARHFNHAGDAQSALPYWVLAGERAQTRGTFTEALTHFTAASASMEVDEAITEQSLRVALGQATCLHYLGRRAEALEALEPLQTNIEHIENRHLVGHFHVSLARVQAFQGQRDASMVSVTKAIEVANACGDRVTEGNAYAWLGRDRMYTASYEEAQISFEHAVELLETAGPSWDLGDSYFRMGMNAAVHCDVNLLQTVARELHEIANALDDPRLHSNALLIEGILMRYQDDSPAGELLCRRAMDAAPEAYDRLFCSSFLASHLLHAGRPTEALELLDPEGVQQFRSRQIGSTTAEWAAWAYLQHGHIDKATAFANTAHKLSAELGGVRQTEFWVPFVRSRVAFQNSELSEAITQMELAIRAADEFGLRGESIYGRLSIARLFTAAGRVDHAESSLQKADRLAVALGSAWYVTQVHKQRSAFALST